MKPEFALSLSFDGITVLTRGAGGWYRLGSVSPDAKDLPEQLAKLRAEALALSEAPLHAKLVLPDSQIRYLSLETGELSHDARISAARSALEGATPYKVDELAFDISVDGAITHVAAVALVTLDEAESFATEHGFAPVSFVAAPEDAAYLGEPFFGTARSARHLTVEPDGIAVVEVPPPADPAVTKGDTAEEPDLYPESAADDDLAPRSDAPIILPAAPPVLDASPEEAAPSTDDSTDTKLADTEDETAAQSAESTSAEEPEDIGPAVGFSSRRSRAKLEVTSTKTTAPKAPSVTPKSASTSEPAAPIAPSATTAKTGVALATSSVPAAPSLALPTPVLAHTTSAPPKPSPSAIAQPVSGPAPEQLQTPQARPMRARSGRIGLLAAGLAAVSAIGAWAVVQELPNLWSDLKRADLIETEDPVATPVLAAPDAALDATKELTTTAQGGLGLNLPSAPARAVATGAETGPAPGELTAETLTETDAAVLEALGAPVVDEAAPLDGQDLIIASLPAPQDITSGTSETALAPIDDEAAVFDDSAEIDPEALADGVVPEDQPTDLLQEAPSELEQAAQYAATGIWQQVPDIADVPALISLDNVYVASIDNTELSQDAIALPAPDAFETDTPFGAVSSPTEAGRQFDFDDRGLVVASPDGTLNPDGIMIYAGRPVKVPPPTPDRPTERVLAAAEEAERLAFLQQVRPRTRPNDLVEQAERAQLGGVVRSELLSKRPKLRPVSLKTEAQESQPATALAVASAPQPRARPTNFANIVDRAQRRQQQAPDQSSSATVASAAVTPAIPSSASVARQATTQRALNLRRLNLIGVYGKPSDRRALVRLPSGRYVKVKVGDRIDGGRIVAIGDSQLQYQKGSRNTVLNLPNG
jgi:type IV pilus biogenesis protein PilP